VLAAGTYFYVTSIITQHDAAYNIQLSTNKEYMDTITATSSTPAYKHPAFSSLKYIKIPTKCRATEGKSHNPNINFINFVNFNNFISVTIHDTYILKVLATFTTHLIHIIWNILKSLIILDFKVVSEGKFWKYVYSTHNIKPKHGLL